MNKVAAIAALGLAALVALGVVWFLQMRPAPADPWASLRQEATAYLAGAPGYAGVADYIEEHFHAIAAEAEREFSTVPPGMKVQSYLIPIEAGFLDQAAKDSRADVVQFFHELPKPPPG